MNKYKPNFQDPRVKKRIVKALEWVNQYASKNNNNWFSTREIDRHLGNQSRPLGSWLKHQLLICSVNYYDPFNGQCKQYRLNYDGYVQICASVGHTPKFNISKELEEQLVSGDFEYVERSNRQFTTAQFIPKQQRRSLLENHGYYYHYDIEAAAPTLLVQRALQLNPQMKDCFPRLIYLILNRSQVRQQIAQECDSDVETVKFLLNSILQGAILTTSKFSVIPEKLNWDYDLIYRFKANTTLCEIRKEIKLLWTILKEDMPVRYLTDKNGKTRRRALSGRDKSGYYRQLEESVGKVIKRHLKRNSLRYLWIHDGWSCDSVIDDVELICEIKRTTGFTVKLDREIFGSSY